MSPIELEELFALGDDAYRWRLRRLSRAILSMVEAHKRWNKGKPVSWSQALYDDSRVTTTDWAESEVRRQASR